VLAHRSGDTTLNSQPLPPARPSGAPARGPGGVPARSRTQRSPAVGPCACRRGSRGARPRRDRGQERRPSPARSSSGATRAVVAPAPGSTPHTARKPADAPRPSGPRRTAPARGSRAGPSGSSPAGNSADAPTPAPRAARPRPRAPGSGGRGWASGSSPHLVTRRAAALGQQVTIGRVVVIADEGLLAAAAAPGSHDSEPRPPSLGSGVGRCQFGSVSPELRVCPRNSGRSRPYATTVGPIAWCATTCSRRPSCAATPSLAIRRARRVAGGGGEAGQRPPAGRLRPRMDRTGLPGEDLQPNRPDRLRPDGGVRLPAAGGPVRERDPAEGRGPGAAAAGTRRWRRRTRTCGQS